MPHVAYVNGQYVPHADAYVHIEDRGYQFADGIYEVCVVVNGRYWDMEGHLARMTRSLNELQMPAPMGMPALKVVMGEVVRRNRLQNALVYMQVTRGVAPRNHAFPTKEIPPALVITARRFDFNQSDAKAAKGVAVISQPDIRWGRVDIKTVGLLPNALAKNAAATATKMMTGPDAQSKARFIPSPRRNSSIRARRTRSGGHGTCKAPARGPCR